MDNIKQSVRNLVIKYNIMDYYLELQDIEGLHQLSSDEINGIVADIVTDFIMEKQFGSEEIN